MEEVIKIPEINIESVVGSVVNEKRCRSFSLTNPRITERALLSARLSPAYKSTSTVSMLRGFNSRSIAINHSIPEDTRSENESREGFEGDIDAGDSPPIDDSLFFDNLDRLKDVSVDIPRVKSVLLSYLDQNEINKLMNMEKGILEEAEDGTLFPYSTIRFKNVAYLWACFKGLISLLPRLESSGCNTNSIGPITGLNALLVSALSNNANCVDYLIKKGAKCDATDSRNFTPLHFAAFGNARDAAQLLLDNGAEIDAPSSATVEPVLHSAIRAHSVDTVSLLLDRGANLTRRNHAGETPLHVACFVQSLECVKLLLGREGVDVNAVAKDRRTPLHFAVMSTSASPELIEPLITSGADLNAVDNEGYTPVHIAALNELPDCVNTLVKSGADLSSETRSGATAFGVIIRKIPVSLDVFKQRLDASIQLRRPASCSREFELRLNFDALYPCRENNETALVNTFLREHRKDLLLHPLVTAFLHLKWEKMRKFYLARIAAYFVTVVCLTAYILTTVTRYRCGFDTPYTSGCRENRLGFFLWRNVIAAEYYLLLFLTCSTAVRKIVGFFVYQSIRQYFSYADNILDIFVVAGLFVAAFAYDRDTNTWQNYVGAIAVLCAWTNLMLMVGQLPAFGTYVAMFTQVQWEFAKLLIAYSGVLIGFTVSFCVSFAGEPSFANPLIGFIKVLAMMAGEVDFEGLMLPGDERPAASYAISLCSQVLFTLFLFFVTVIMMNLLVGIAVDDIKGLRRDAGITKVVRQTNLIVFVEIALRKSIFPKRIREWIFDSHFSTRERKRVLLVKPLNPLEKRLPKDILCAAYEIGKKNAPMELDSGFDEEEKGKSPDGKAEIDISALNQTIDKLSERLNAHEEGIRIIREQLDVTNRTLEEILAVIKGTDC